jgi:hypothetical protein
VRAAHDSVRKEICLPFNVIYMLVCANRCFRDALQRRACAAGAHSDQRLLWRLGSTTGLSTVQREDHFAGLQCQQA